MSLQFVSFVQCVRDIFPLGEGPPHQLGLDVWPWGQGGIGVGDTGGTDVCVAKIGRHVNMCWCHFCFFFVPKFFFVFCFFCFAMLEFLPLPPCERCELVYYSSKKEDEIETDTVSLYLRTSIMFCHLVSHTLMRSQFSSLSCFHYKCADLVFL